MARKKQITLVSKKTVIKIAEAFKVEAGKSYMINIPDFDMEDMNALREAFSKHGVEDVIVVSSDSMTVSEIPKVV